MFFSSRTILYSGWVLAVVLTLVFLTLGQAHWYASGKKDQLQADIARLEKNNYNIVPVDKIMAFNGKFVAFNDSRVSSISFENTDVPNNPLLHDYPRVRRAVLDSDTQVILRTAKNIRDFNAEVARARVTKGNLNILPYTESAISVSTIEVGKYIQVVARDPGMAYKETFVASKVIVNPSPSFNQVIGR